MTDLAQDSDDIQALMAPPRAANVYSAVEAPREEAAPAARPNVYAALEQPQAEAAAPARPNVYAALEQLQDEPAADAAAAPVTPEARADREIEWSALAADPTTPETGTEWSDMGAEPVGPEVLRWRREDDDIVPSGQSAGKGRSRMRLTLRRRSAA